MGNSTCMTCDKSDLGKESVLKLNQRSRHQMASDQNNVDSGLSNLIIQIQPQKMGEPEPTKKEDFVPVAVSPKPEEEKALEIPDPEVSSEEMEVPVKEKFITRKQLIQEQKPEFKEKEEGVSNSKDEPKRKESVQKSKEEMEENEDFVQHREEKIEKSPKENSPEATSNGKSPKLGGSQEIKSEDFISLSKSQIIPEDHKESSNLYKNRKESDSSIPNQTPVQNSDAKKKKAHFPNEEEDGITENVVSLDKPMSKENVSNLVKILKNHYTFSRLQNDEM